MGALCPAAAPAQARRPQAGALPGGRLHARLPGPARAGEHADRGLLLLPAGGLFRGRGHPLCGGEDRRAGAVRPRVVRLALLDGDGARPPAAPSQPGPDRRPVGLAALRPFRAEPGGGAGVVVRVRLSAGNAPSAGRAALAAGRQRAVLCRGHRACLHPARQPRLLQVRLPHHGAAQADLALRRAQGARQSRSLQRVRRLRQAVPDGYSHPRVREGGAARALDRVRAVPDLHQRVPDRGAVALLRLRPPRQGMAGAERRASPQRHPRRRLPRRGTAARPAAVWNRRLACSMWRRGRGASTAGAAVPHGLPSHTPCPTAVAPRPRWGAG